MPLKDRDRTRPRRLVRAGIIRLGYKETKTKKRSDGSSYEVEYPVQADHFVLTDAPEVAAFYGEESRELDVILPFPDVARNFDAAYTVWAGGVLVCRGDGEFVQYATPHRAEEGKKGQMRVYNAPGDTRVSDGVAQCAFNWNSESFSPGDLVPCSGAAQDLYPHCRACRMSAILKVMMAQPELFRLAYYQIATGSGRNYDTILGTLELIHQQAGKVSGIPFKLRLVREPTTFRDANGTRRQTEKWFLQLEPDPDLTRALYARSTQALVGAPSKALPVSIVDPDTGEIVGAEPEAPPPFAEDGGPAEEPEPEPANGDRPYPPETVRRGLRGRAGWTKDEEGEYTVRQADDEQSPPDPRDVQRAAALIEAAFDMDANTTDDKTRARRAVLMYAFGQDSGKLLTGLETRALLTWLETEAEDDEPDSWKPNDYAIQEAWQMFAARGVEKGQMALDLVEEEIE